jgi:hypothetical protein
MQDPDFAKRAEERRRSMTAFVARSWAQADAIGAALERRMTPEQRAEAVWGLTCELWSNGGDDGSQFRLDRSVARLERRRR